MSAGVCIRNNDSDVYTLETRFEPYEAIRFITCVRSTDDVKTIAFWIKYRK